MDDIAIKEAIKEIEIGNVDLQKAAGLDELRLKVRAFAEQSIERSIKYGDTLYEQIKELDKVKPEDEHAQIFIQSHRVGSLNKQFVILLRDIYFELYKTKALEIEGELESTVVANLINETKRIIGEAIDDLENSRSIQSSAQEVRLLLKQDHPWPEYRIQIVGLSEHFVLVDKSHEIVTKLGKTLADSKLRILAGLVALKDAHHHLIDSALSVQKLTEGHDAEQIIEQINVIKNDLEISKFEGMIHHPIEAIIQTAQPKVSPVVATEGGMLIEKDLTPQYSLEQWYDIEILPLFEEAIILLDGLLYGLRLGLINISNSLDHQTRRKVEFDLDQQFQPLEIFRKSSDEVQTELDRIEYEIQTKTESNLSLRQLFNRDGDFLSLGFQSAIEKFSKEQNLILERIINGWQWLKNKYNAIRTTVAEESQLSKTEKVVRYVDQISIDRLNVNYNNFFSTKVSMIEAFWIQRELEEKRIHQVVQSWSRGYLGTILIHGDRFSGKSSMGEWVNQKYFRGKNYSIKPNSKLTISNSTIELGNDLDTAIRLFIDRVQYARPVIWIDDLEMWTSPDQRIYSVVKKLLQIIDEYSSKVFFMVSMSTWIFNKLVYYSGIDQSFQACIGLSDFTKSQIRDAIILRHGASQKNLVRRDGMEVNKALFDKMTSQVYKESDGNIGQALQLWLTMTSYKDDDFVLIHQVTRYGFPNIIEADNGILLTTLLLYRELSEEDLQKMFGPAYDLKYKIIVNQLVGLGVIRRKFNSKLSINPRVVTEISRLLMDTKFIA
ncbi:MAG: hypothetical protein KJP00_09085 [Bacteroidia bacterium]|nr:hypothetical protein [Bacteroidia bacterium]